MEDGEGTQFPRQNTRYIRGSRMMRSAIDGWMEGGKRRQVENSTPNSRHLTSSCPDFGGFSRFAGYRVQSTGIFTHFTAPSVPSQIVSGPNSLVLELTVVELMGLRISSRACHSRLYSASNFPRSFVAWSPPSKFYIGFFWLPRRVFLDSSWQTEVTDCHG
jgi:hypothetical protein